MADAIPLVLELPGFQERLVDKFKSQNLKQIYRFPYQDEGEFMPGSYQSKKLLEYINLLNNEILQLFK